MKNYILGVAIFILIIMNLLQRCGSGNIENENVSDCHPVAIGTFIQDYLVAEWDDERWQKEFAILKEVGMKYLILAPTLHSDKHDITKAIYESKIDGVKKKYATDLVDNCLRNAKKAGFKVFLGLNFHEKWWSASFTPEWLFAQMEIGNQVAYELMQKFKDKYQDTMYGWYWVWEVDNLHAKTVEKQDVLIQAMNINIDYLNEITPGMPFMFSPFVNYRVGNSYENRDMWAYVLSRVHFREGDIFAPQDCVGAGGLELQMLDEWFRLMSESVILVPGLEFWSNTETFDQRFWTAAPINRFIKQMQLVNPYVDQIITFAYSHYYSPFIKTHEFHDVYLHYVKNGSLPRIPDPSSVEKLQVYRRANAIVVEWKEPVDREYIVGYYVFRNGELIGDIQYDANNKCETMYIDSDILKSGKYIYKVCAYTCDGKMSSPQSFEVEK